MMTKLKPCIRILFLSFMIALIIFVTSIFSQFSAQMYTVASQQRNGIGLVETILIAIVVLTVLVFFLFALYPPIRNAMLKMFGLDESDKKREDDSPKKQT